MRFLGQLRLVLLALVLLVGAVGCSDEAPIGSVVFHNDSDIDVLVLTAVSTDFSLEGAVERKYVPVTNRPGAVIPYGFAPRKLEQADGSVGTWCSNLAWYVVRSKSGRVWEAGERDENPPLEVSDLEVLAKIEPGYCWGKEESDWYFEG